MSDQLWYEGQKRKEINAAMRRAYEAMDRAYHRSQTNDDLLNHTTECSRALAEVRRHARENHL
ncbi:hypothetical protein SEA_CLIFTON_78 [Mycobacterium phage Clifton]|nr:hypothetical protein SEA_CLIFTON_78 [Mycobacterium phage Clifton]